MPKSLSKTPAPKKDRIYGSDKNKVGSASSKASAKGIELSESILGTLSQKAKDYNESHPKNKVSVATLKAVMRRGMGAYSTSHRPTITGGAPNSRQAWGFARVNKFLKKKAGQQVKAAYVQDDDLMADGGDVKKFAFIEKWEGGFYWLITKDGDNNYYNVDGDKRLSVVKDMAKRWGYNLVSKKQYEKMLSDSKLADGGETKKSKEAYTIVGVYKSTNDLGREESEDLTKEGLLGYRIRYNKMPLQYYAYVGYENTESDLERAKSDVARYNKEVEDEKERKKARDLENKIKREKQKIIDAQKLEAAKTDDTPKPAYLMTKSEYEDRVIPLLKEYEKFARKNSEYLANTSYSGLYKTTFEQVLSRVLEGKNTGRRFDADSEKGAIRNWNYTKFNRYADEKMEIPAPTPKDILEKNVSFFKDLNKFFADKVIFDNLDSEYKKSNKPEIRRAIEDDTYKKLLENGEITEEEVIKIAEEHGIKVPKRVFSQESNLKKEAKKQMDEILSKIPKMNQEVFESLYKQLFDDFKDVEKIVIEQETERFEGLIKEYIELSKKEGGIEKDEIESGIIFWRDIFMESQPRVVKTKDYRGYPKNEYFYKDLELKSDYKPIMDKIILNYAESLKYRFLKAVLDNFPRVSKPITNITRKSIKVGKKGFEGVYRFNFADGSYFDFVTEAIPAAGYNIVSFHYRYLTRLENATLADGTKIKGYYEIMQKFSSDSMADGGELDYTKDALEFFKKELGIKSDIVLVQSKSSFDPISMSQTHGHASAKKDNKFYVGIDFNETKNRFIRTLAHELVHVKQMEDNRLRFEDNKIIFDEEKMTYDEYQKKYHSDDIPKFEDEAFTLERVLQNKYAENENSYADGGSVGQEITCVNCGWHWNTSDSEESDKYICHKCGFDNRTFYDPEPIGEYHLGGDISKHLAPNGKPSNLNHEQWHLVRTPEFKAWFGDWENDPENASKVVDENGEPLVVYRGMPKKRRVGNVFRYNVNLWGTKGVGGRQTNKFAFYFTDIKEVAEGYVDDITEEEGGYVVKSYFLNIRKLFKAFTKKNQYETTFKELYDLANTSGEPIYYKDYRGDIETDYKGNKLEVWNHRWEWERKYNDKFRIQEATFSFFVDWNKDQANQYFWRLYLEDYLKYNGLVFYETTNNGIREKVGDDLRPEFGDEFSKTYAVFEPNNIKLADGTNTTFDSKNPDVRYAEGGTLDIPSQHDLIKMELGLELFKPSKTIEQIAKEKDVPLDYAEEQLRKGMKTESEHSDNPIVQETIALQHLDEMIDYYEKLEYMESQNKMAKGDLLDNSLFNKALIYKSIKPIRQANEIIERLDYMEIQNKMAKGGVTEFYKQYQDWYKNGVSDKMTIMVSVPNAFSKMSSEDNHVILDVFEKRDESVDGKEKLKELLELADNNGIDVYLEPIPRHNKIKDEAKKQKITRKYLISYYEKFGFELLPNGFMVRKHKNNKMEKGGYYKAGGEINPDDKNVKDYFSHGSGNVGGVLVGKRHSEGGIKAVNKSTNQPLEMEGGEVVITRNAVSDNQKREFEGKMMTNREILSKINESGGGVSFDKGGEVEKHFPNAKWIEDKKSYLVKVNPNKKDRWEKPESIVEFEKKSNRRYDTNWDDEGNVYLYENKYLDGGETDYQTQLKNHLFPKVEVEVEVEPEMELMPTHEHYITADDLGLSDGMPMLAVGTIVYSSGGNDQWEVVSFSDDGVNLVNKPKSPLQSKMEDKHLTFDELIKYFKDKAISIKNISTERELEPAIALVRHKIPQKSYAMGGFIDGDEDEDAKIMQSQFGKSNFR